MATKRWQLQEMLEEKDKEIEKLKMLLRESMDTLDFYVEHFKHSDKHAKKAQQALTKIKTGLEPSV